MVEGWGGKVSIWKLSLMGGIIPLRGLRELIETVKARRDFAHVQRDWGQLMRDKRHKDMLRYITHHKNGRDDAVNYAKHFLQLMQNCAYDALMIKRILEVILKEDEKLVAEGLTPVQIKSLKDEVRGALNEVNKDLRIASDEMGALTRK